MRIALALILALLVPGSALAYQVPISDGSRSVYLRVGDGEYQREWFGVFGDIVPWIDGGRPRSGGDVSRVRVELSPLDIGNGVPQPMTGNGRTSSDYDGFEFCSPGQIYIGGYFRRPGGSDNFAAQLSVLSPSALTKPQGGASIPVTEISWTSSGLGDSGAQPVPPGQLVPGSSLLTTFPQNMWTESCLSFTYANSQVVAAGTYSTTVTFTLVTP